MSSIHRHWLSSVRKSEQITKNNKWHCVLMIMNVVVLELQISRTNGFGGVFANHRSNACTFSNRMSKLRKTSK
jgi:hypothetical protein